ncbi:hypothetical protein CRENBAI_022587 [Crenichthys baileyi]|uniref:Fibrinogen C-terminal domain-containing protein n=1 Tax=Crenichthys baileyi TaxID=28760 RepID=A0AAV9RZT5_9TELE
MFVDALTGNVGGARQNNSPSPSSTPSLPPTSPPPLTVTALHKQSWVFLAPSPSSIFTLSSQDTMRLTAFCVCGILLAFSSLSRIRAEEGVLHGDWGFGPCTVTLRPAGACRPGEQESTCPYHISLPPLVVHLPQHFLDLENIMQDLQKLKDSVDELREMCADCTGGQAGRKCGRQSEADLKGGKSTREDEGDWMNERLEENDRDFRQECGKEGVKVGTKDGDNMEKKLNDWNKWETGGDVKENNREEPVTEGARGEDTLEELKMPTSGGNMQTVNVTREQIAETNPKGSAKKYQDDILEKNKEEAKEESGQPMWRDKTKKPDKNTKAEAFDRVKMSKNHTVNIHKEQEQMEMEKGIKVDPNKKKPKQMERFGFTEKGREIKTESVQKDGDGETSYSTITEKTDFLSINLTTIMTGLTLRLDSSDTKSFTSSLPSPSLLSSTLSSITDVIPDPEAGYGLTRSTDPGAGGVTEPHSQDKAMLPTTIETISTVGGPREQITNAKARLTTTTPHQSSFITSSPRVIEGSRVAPKNISSKIKIALKPPPFRAPKPGEKQKSGIKPEAENRLKNAKNDHKRNQGPSIEGKTKLNQKQKPREQTVRLKEAVEPEPSPQTKTGPSQISWGPSGHIQTSRTDMPPTSGLVKQIAIVSHTPRETEFSTSVRKTITLSPKTSNSLETGYFPALQAHPEEVTSSPNTRITSDLRPQTAGPPSSVPRTTRPNKINNGILQNVFTSTGPGSTQPSVAPKPKAKTLYVEKSPSASPVPSPSLETTSTLSTNFRPKTSSTSGPELPPAELSTPGPRELRVKINQVAAFVNNSLIPNGRSGELPKEQPNRFQRGRGHERTDGKLPTSAASTAIRDCSDHSLRGRTRSGVYLVTPDLRGSSFPVFCDMELDGGGWTLLQRRQDGSVSFNRTWVEYQAGFGVLNGGEFWLGNNKMHLLTRDRDMVLRVELEDFDGLTEHAQYEHFRVASERLRYRLTVGGYSGTAGDALRFSRTYDHNNRMFTTPDRDHDRYPSGNCGAYYSSGWWFDACMAANLNGRYYVGKYKGVRDGIYWGTWHNISTEYYPTNERLSFKRVRMMIRPKSFGPR